MNILQIFVRSIFLEFIYSKSIDVILLEDPVVSDCVPNVVANHEDIRNSLLDEVVDFKSILRHFSMLSGDSVDMGDCAMTIVDCHGKWWDVVLTVKISENKVTLTRKSVEEFS